MRTLAAALFVGVLYAALIVASIVAFDGPSAAGDHVTRHNTLRLELAD